jgi:predicted RNA-binding Zn-ribbon protein involved in translation (DUF1610 family)
MKCPLCGKGMTQMSESSSNFSPTETSRKQEALYYCEQHGVMNRSTDLKHKADQIARKV